MSSSMDTDLLESEVGFEEDSHDSDLGDEGVEEGSEEEDVYEEEEGHIEEPETQTGKDGQMIESYDKRELILATGDGDVDIEPYEGMEFDSEDAARVFYISYARRAGFRVRVSKCRRSVHDGTVICRRFVCSKEGFYVQNDQASTMRQRVVSRVGCMARIVVKKLSSGKWLVTRFEREHNHDPVAPRRVELKSYAMADVKKIENPVEELGSPKKEMVLPQPRGDPNLEPYEGMEFHSEEAARMFYYEYAKDLGFTVRISKCRRAKDGSIICRRFVCSKEGYYVRKFGRTKRSRALTRVGCMARLIVKKQDSGVWVVASFEREHNHPPFVEGKELRYQPPKATKRINRSSRAALEPSSGSIVNRCEQDVQNSQNNVAWRFNKLHQEGIKFAEEGASSVEIFNVAMFSLREATQKVIVAKKSVAPIAQGNEGNKLMLASNSGNDTSSNPQNSDEVRQGASQGGLMLVQQPLNLVLIAPGLQNKSGQSSLAINIPNGQGVQGSTDNQPLNITVPVSVHKGQTLDGNGSVDPSISSGRKRKQRSGDDDSAGHLDGSTATAQGWNVIAGSNTGSKGDSPSVALSDAQVAALQAVAEAFNVPTMGSTSSSALPIKVSPVSAEVSDVNKRCTPEPQDPPRTPSGRNPMLHAAAIAAGARIASPAVAASIIKAVQSRTSVHVRSGGSIPKLPIRGGELFGARSPGLHQANNVHFFQTRETPLSPVNIGAVPHVSVPEVQEAGVAEVSETQTTIEEQIDLLNDHAGEDQMADHYQIVDDRSMVGHLYGGSSPS